jgi:hypothetical protein
MKFLLLLIVSLCSLQVAAQLTYETVFVDYDSAWEYKNLKVIPIRAKAVAAPVNHDLDSGFITLGKAIEEGLVTVTERGTASTENVHWLRVNNRSKRPLYISSGEIMIGGRQDRMISRDTILIPNGHDQYVTAMCVEEGRWSNKEKKFAYGKYADPRLRKVLDQSGNQVKIWKEIFDQLQQTKVAAPSLGYVAPQMDKKNAIKMDDFLEFFMRKIDRSDSSVIGIICISGENILGTDIFSSSNLFYDQAAALLSGYIYNAMAFGSSPEVGSEKVEEFMDKILKDENSQREYCKHNGKIFSYDGRVIHLTAY